MNENAIIYSIPFLTTLIAFIKVYTMIKKFDLSDKVKVLEDTLKDKQNECKVHQSGTQSNEQRIALLESAFNLHKEVHSDLKEQLKSLERKIDRLLERGTE